MLSPPDLSFYEFDEENDQELRVLLCDVVHGKPPMKPLYIGLGWYWAPTESAMEQNFLSSHFSRWIKIY